MPKNKESQEATAGDFSASLPVETVESILSPPPEPLGPSIGANSRARSKVTPSEGGSAAPVTRIDARPPIKQLVQAK